MLYADFMENAKAASTMSHLYYNRIRILGLVGR